jgi:hypothetical protein
LLSTRLLFVTLSQHHDLSSLYFIDKSLYMAVDESDRNLAKAFPFLSLPRELRDQIYHLMLYSDKVSRPGAEVNGYHNIWIPKRRSMPGYYRPIQNYYKDTPADDPDENFNNDSELRTSHKTQIAPVPALFHVGGEMAREARECYFRRHILLAGLWPGLFVGELRKWRDGSSPRDRKMIQRVDVDVRGSMHMNGESKLVFESKGGGPQDAALLKRLHEIEGHKMDVISPLIRIEIQNGTRLAILSSAKIDPQMVGPMQTRIMDWWLASAPSTVLNGRHVLEASLALLTAVHEKRTTYWEAKVDVRQVAEVYEHEGLRMRKGERHTTVVRLKDSYPHVVMRLCLPGI